MKKPRTLYIYIMYSKKINAYKIGESVAPERRLKEIQKGSAYGDSSTILVDKFPVDEKLLVHRAKTNVDSVFHLGINKRHKFPNAHYSEWFDISKEEAFLAIEKGFEKLKNEASDFRQKQFKDRWGRRYSRMLERTIQLKSFADFSTSMVFLQKIYNKLKGNIEIKVSDKSLYRLSTYHFKSYVSYKTFFDLLLGEITFYRALFLFLSDRKRQKMILKDTDLMNKIDSIIQGQKQTINKWIIKTTMFLPKLVFNRSAIREVREWNDRLEEDRFLIEVDWYINKRYYSDIEQTFVAWFVRLTHFH